MGNICCWAKPERCGRRAYDKIARAIGLPYPGGPQIEKLAREGNPAAIELPRAWMGEDSFDFSFSRAKIGGAELI